MSKRPPTVLEESYISLVVALGCLVCLKEGYGYVEAVPHHPSWSEGKSQRAGHFMVIPLCPGHHTDGGGGKIAIHAGRQSFETMYKVTEKTLVNKTVGEVYKALIVDRWGSK